MLSPMDEDCSDDCAEDGADDTSGDASEYEADDKTEDDADEADKRTRRDGTHSSSGGVLAGVFVSGVRISMGLRRR
jgi:hypothetical protein